MNRSLLFAALFSLCSVTVLSAGTRDSSGSSRGGRPGVVTKEDIEADPDVKAAKDALDQAKKDLQEAQGKPGTPAKKIEELNKAKEEADKAYKAAKKKAEAEARKKSSSGSGYGSGTTRGR